MRKISFLFLLAIAVTVVFSQEERLLLTHSYPENRNFNKVELNCRFNSRVLAEEPRFLRNRTTDIMDIHSIAVLHYDGERGSVIFMFDQDGEGLFTCALGTSMLSNPIALAGAVAEGVTGHIDIGVAFNGPFQYPPGLVPVSPVFWICVRGQENFQFQQPVTVTVRHCLHIDFCTRAPSSGLTFVVAKHSSNSYERLQAESRGTFTSGCTGMISTKHLSCLCICCDNAFDRTEYSLIQVPAESPCHATVDLHSATDISYYITYNLPYCIEAVKYYVKGRSVRNTKFHFQSQSEEHAFIQVQHPEEICGCLISSRALRDSHNYPDKKITPMIVREISLPNTNEGGRQQEYWAWPHFSIHVAGSPDYNTKLYLQFVGAREEMQFDIILHGRYGSLPSSMSSSVLGGIDRQSLRTTQESLPSVRDSRLSLTLKPDMTDLHSFVAARIPHRWRAFGTQLGISQNTLEAIASMGNQLTNPQDHFLAVLHEWEKRGVQFTWDKVIEVLRSHAIKEYVLANEIYRIQSSRLSL